MLRGLVTAAMIAAASSAVAEDVDVKCGEFAGHMMTAGSTDRDFFNRADKFTAVGLGMVIGATIASSANAEDRAHAEKEFFGGIMKRCMAAPSILLSEAIREEVKSLTP